MGILKIITLIIRFAPEVIKLVKLIDSLKEPGDDKKTIKAKVEKEVFRRDHHR